MRGAAYGISCAPPLRAAEVAVRTRWPEKPYTVYDMLDGEVQAVSWPDAVPEEVRENLMCIWEQ